MNRVATSRRKADMDAVSRTWGSLIGRKLNPEFRSSFAIPYRIRQKLSGALVAQRTQNGVIKRCRISDIADANRDVMKHRSVLHLQTRGLLRFRPRRQAESHSGLRTLT